MPDQKQIHYIGIVLDVINRTVFMKPRLMQIYLSFACTKVYHSVPVYMHYVYRILKLQTRRLKELKCSEKSSWSNKKCTEANSLCMVLYATLLQRRESLYFPVWTLGVCSDKSRKDDLGR